MTFTLIIEKKISFRNHTQFMCKALTVHFNLFKNYLKTVPFNLNHPNARWLVTCLYPASAYRITTPLAMHVTTMSHMPHARCMRWYHSKWDPHPCWHSRRKRPVAKNCSEITPRAYNWPSQKNNIYHLIRFVIRYI